MTGGGPHPGAVPVPRMGRFVDAFARLTEGPKVP